MLSSSSFLFAAIIDSSKVLRRIGIIFFIESSFTTASYLRLSISGITRDVFVSVISSTQ